MLEADATDADGSPPPEEVVDAVHQAVSSPGPPPGPHAAHLLGDDATIPAVNPATHDDRRPRTSAEM